MLVQNTGIFKIEELVLYSDVAAFCVASRNLHAMLHMKRVADISTFASTFA